jgi:hypothetical protein
VKQGLPTCLLLSWLMLSSSWGEMPNTPGSPLQEQACFLAGLTLPKRSVLANLQKSREYRDHQRELQEEWHFCRRVRYEVMQKWALEHLSRHESARGVVRYLFGGPDFLNADAFFPESRILVLGGLEPIGEVPPPETLDQEGFAGSMKSLRAALHTSLFCGYFITTEMKPQLRRGSFQGVLPVLYTELALTGKTIVSMERIKPFGSPGVRIDFRQQDGQPRSLYYFQADLSNGTECRRFLQWLGELGPGASYLKAASYLLPLDSFSEARSFLLKTSTLILQDDSGIPFRDFDPTAWKLQLFGFYTDPLPIFARRRESELDAAYNSPLRSGPLPFGVGYHVRADDANLLLATRDAEAPDPVQTKVSAGPASRPTPVPIRKAIPMEIRKALPVEVRKAIPMTPSP